MQTVVPVSGITPAYAGNTILQMVRNFMQGDHPRLRGEHIRIHCICYFKLGSPPPTRGTPFTYESDKF